MPSLSLNNPVDSGSAQSTSSFRQTRPSTFDIGDAEIKSTRLSVAVTVDEFPVGEGTEWTHAHGSGCLHTEFTQVVFTNPRFIQSEVVEHCSRSGAT